MAFSTKSGDKNPWLFHTPIPVGFGRPPGALPALRPPRSWCPPHPRRARRRGLEAVAPLRRGRTWDETPQMAMVCGEVVR